jgi:hypothetical protein
MTPLERITERVSRDGDVNNPETPRPLVTLEEFFEGNDISGSICCNLSPMPEPAEVYAVLKQIRARGDVADVRIEITMFDIPEWPFSDTVWIITSAAPQEVRSWFSREMAPDEVYSGWSEGTRREAVEVPAGMVPVCCWYD